MQHKSLLIIGLLIFSLLIQNTCLQGYAGKSAVITSFSHEHCPHHHHHLFTVRAEGDGSAIIAEHPDHHPLFVLEMPNSEPTFRLASITYPQPVVPNTYKKSFPCELLRPPQA